MFHYLYLKLSRTPYTVLLWLDRGPSLCMWRYLILHNYKPRWMVIRRIFQASVLLSFHFIWTHIKNKVKQQKQHDLRVQVSAVYFSQTEPERASGMKGHHSHHRVCVCVVTVQGAGLQLSSQSGCVTSRRTADGNTNTLRILHVCWVILFLLTVILPDILH